MIGELSNERDLFSLCDSTLISRKFSVFTFLQRIFSSPSFGFFLSTDSVSKFESEKSSFANGLLKVFDISEFDFSLNFGMFFLCRMFLGIVLNSCAYNIIIFQISKFRIESKDYDLSKLCQE